MSRWLGARAGKNDEPAPVDSALAAVQGDSEDSWNSGWSARCRADLTTSGRRTADDRRARFVREAERSSGSIIDAAGGRQRILLAKAETTERPRRERALEESLRPNTGKNGSVSVARSSPEQATAARGSERRWRDRVGVPSPGLVEAFDDCLASVASRRPEWTAPGIFANPPRRRDRRWRKIEHVLARKIRFYCLLLAVSGLVGWLTAELINALAK